MQKYLETVFGVYWFLSFSVVSVSALALIAIVPGVTTRRRIAHYGARLIFWLTAMPAKLDGAELLPDETAVVVANHASYLDGIIMTAALPPRFAFVIKKEMTEIPLAHFFLRRIGSHFVERGNARKGALDARQILRSAKARVSLGFFPEGTFRREPGLGPFRPGAFRIAAHSGLPVVPAIIRGSRDILPDGRLLPRPGRLSVTLTEPIRSLPADELLSAARRQILKNLDEPDLIGDSAGIVAR